jgi:hypothetical protein
MAFGRTDSDHYSSGDVHASLKSVIRRRAQKAATVTAKREAVLWVLGKDVDPHIVRGQCPNLRHIRVR